MDGLDDRDQAILDFERQSLHKPGSKEQQVRRTFGLSLARYYQVLNRIIDSPEALAAEPMLVRRLQRIRRQRMSTRAGRTV